jgi:hypothetical protein
MAPGERKPRRSKPSKASAGVAAQMAKSTGPSAAKKVGASAKGKAAPRAVKPAASGGAAPDAPETVIVLKTPEIDAKDPLASGASAPLRPIWLKAAGQARDTRKVAIDLVGEGRGVMAVPVSFETEEDAMKVMTPALDVLVRHCAQATGGTERPVMVDLQELRERLKLAPEEDWIVDHKWFNNALTSRELLCMYVFSPAYLFEFAAAIGEKQRFDVAIAKQDPGFYELTLKAEGEEGGVIVWNWARAIADVIAGGHAWSYFGLLLALAPQVAKQKRADREAKKASTEEE